jgi:predicted ATPase/class 3 adenylate cyclase
VLCFLSPRAPPSFLSASRRRTCGTPRGYVKLRHTSTLTFLFTDIEGSTQKLTRLGDAYTAILNDHHRIIRDALNDHEGREVDTAGDGFFCVFDSPRSGISSVIEMQRGFASHAWPAGEEVRVRMGLHTGEATIAPTGIVGLDVHKAARIAAVAYGGQVLVSEATAMLVRDLLTDGVSLRDLGSHRLKDLNRPEVLFQLEAVGLETTFPPLRSLSAHNLPVQLTTFVGRDAQLQQVGELIHAHRLVTITGPGGCGKTRLALQVAQTLRDTAAGGVWFVDLAPLRQPADVASAVAFAVGAREAPPEAIETTILRTIAGKSIVLLLDNCEHVLDTLAPLAERLLRSTEGLKVLCTSREPLGIVGEHLSRIPPLDVPREADQDASSIERSEAVQLFCERARAQDSGFRLDEASAPHVAAVCRRLDGIPLALELAAARVRALPVAEIERRLTDRFALLAGTSRSAQARQRTLEATIDWSWELLGDPERAALARLSVFVGAFSLEAAAAIADIPGAIDAVATLVDRSLVQRDSEYASGDVASSSYRLLESIRDYGARRLAAQGAAEEEAARGRHERHFLSRWSRGGRPSLGGGSGLLPTDREQYLADRDDLVAAIRHAVGTPPLTDETFAAVISSVNAVSSEFERRLAGQLLADLVAGATAATDPQLRALADRDLAYQLCFVGDFRAAQPLVEDALRLVAPLDDPQFYLDCIHLAGYIANRSGDRAAARELATRLGVVIASDSPADSVATARLDRSQLLVPDDPSAAIADAEAALAHFESTGDSYANIASQLRAWILAELGDIPRAAELLVEEHGRARWRNDNDRIGHEYMLAIVLALAGDLSTAAAHALQLLDLCVGPDTAGVHAEALLAVALCLDACGFTVESARAHGAVQGSLAQSGEVLMRFETTLHNGGVDAVRVTLGHDDFERYFAEGRSLDYDQMVATARPLLVSCAR